MIAQSSGITEFLFWGPKRVGGGGRPLSDGV